MVLSQAYLEWEQAEQRGEQRGRQEGEQQGRQEEALSFVLRLLPRRVGIVPPKIEAQIRTLSLQQLEELGEALLDFSQISDLQNWLCA
jgi:predicted transposase YdaD